MINQRGLLVDPIRRKLFWVGSDTWQRQELIYRSELDGSSPEVVYGAPEGMQIRALAIDPYSQKLYWLDPTAAGGTLFWADADGNRLAPLAADLGSDARGLIVRPYEDALYYVAATTWCGKAGRQQPDRAGRPEPAALHRPLSARQPDQLWANLHQPAHGQPGLRDRRALCRAALCRERQPRAEQQRGAATPIGLGVTTGALCKTDAALPQDIDFYTVTVPTGKQLNVTLSNLPADYDLYVQRAGQTLAISRTAGLANETIALANYEDDADYTSSSSAAHRSTTLRPTR